MHVLYDGEVRVHEKFVCCRPMSCIVLSQYGCQVVTYLVVYFCVLIVGQMLYAYSNNVSCVTYNSIGYVDIVLYF